MTVNVEAKTLELALVKAAGQLGITQGDMAYEVVSESSGLLGLFGKKVSVKAWKKASERSSSNRRSGRGRDRDKAARLRVASSDSASSSADSAELEKRVLSGDEIDSLVDELAGFCGEICTQMVGGEEVAIGREVTDGRLVLNIENDIIAGHFAKSTKLAEAFEHILRKKPRHLRQELPFRVFVDCNNIRRDREQELVSMAHDLSTKVAESKRPIVLNYRSSYDRKIIHMALDKHETVSTKSIGSGANRKLMILPAEQAELENA